MDAIEEQDIVSDSDIDEIIPNKIPRLGNCEVCNASNAIYTCPKCEVKTCRLKCSQIHKKELACNGIRDRTKYIPLRKMTKMDVMNDYYFLEEATRYTENRKKDRIKRFTRNNSVLPNGLFRLRNAAGERKTFLRFLLQNFTKRKDNTTFYNALTKTISWRIEWIFTNAENLKYLDDNCSENESIASLLDKYLNPKSTIKIPLKKSLEYYQSKGISNLKILLKSEGIKKCKNRYYELDSSKTLKDNLAGKTLVEFPCIHVCYDSEVLNYDIIDSDEDVLAETRLMSQKLKESYRKQCQIDESKKLDESLNKTDEEIKKELEEIEKEKKLEERHKKREKLEKEPCNLLFSDESFWDGILSSDSETENNTINKPVVNGK